MQKTLCLPLVIEIDENGDVRARTDRANTIHNDGKRHFGFHLTMGKGAMMNVSEKLGLNKVISIETEVVVDEERFHKCS